MMKDYLLFVGEGLLIYSFNEFTVNHLEKEDFMIFSIDPKNMKLIYEKLKKYVSGIWGSKL